MSADPIVYCLERLTDYRQFERFCSDLMAGCGYSGIDPLGGSGDSGRDAIFCSTSSTSTTIFAYTVRSDWRKKLEQDCGRIKDAGHELSKVVFVCTSTLTASEKDDARATVRSSFGWDLELYDIERIRVLLSGEQRHLVAQHPSIFCPPFFPQKAGLSISPSPDTVVIDHVARDHALATWLAKRLALSGFETWCYGTAPLAGETADESIRKLIETRAAQYLPVLSNAAGEDPNFIDRCAAAGARNDLILPCWASAVGTSRFPSRLASISPADFTQSWAIGLRHVLSRLSARGITPRHDAERGRRIALGEYVPQPVTVAKPERVFANVFSLQLPPSMLVCDLQYPLSVEERDTLRRTWAFVEARPHRLLAFCPPPASVQLLQSGGISEFQWEAFERSEGKKTQDIAKELARRSLDVACARAGLQWCDHRQLHYFPRRRDGEWNQAITHVDGRETRVALTGERTQGWGERASKFFYQLAPIFRPGKDESGEWWVTLRIYIRTTTLDDKLFEGKEIGRRRKTVGRNWWNREWLARMLGVMQALRSDDTRIRVGNDPYAVVVDTSPLEWSCPVALDVLALSRIADLGKEIAEVRTREEEDEDVSAELPPPTEVEHGG